MTSRRWIVPLLGLALTLGTGPKTQGQSGSDPISKIRDEGLNRSQVMEIASYLTDVIGPRLTSSPGLKRANEWTRDTMTKWGLENAKLEAWGPFGRGWTLEKFSAQLVEPQCVPLIAFPKAWSSGVDGTLKAEVVLFDPKTESELAGFEGKLTGKIVMISSPRELKAWFEPPGIRLTDSQLLVMADAGPPGQRRMSPTTPTPTPPTTTAAAPTTPTPGQPGARPATPAPPASEARPQTPSMSVLRKKGELLSKEKPALIIDCSSRGDGGTLFVQSASMNPGVFSFSRNGPRVWDKDAPAIVPQITMSIEHYGRLARMIQAGEKLVMAVDLDVKYHDDDLMSYNTVAEIPGTDKADEIVMVGGHIDSWHGGTGATDNAAGVATAMEAVRILKTLDLKMKRTVRVGLWSGEEQGLYGSRAYVKEHFGSYETPEPAGDNASAKSESSSTSRRELKKGPDYEKLSVYFNFDNGTGKIRGIHMENNEAARPIFRKWLEPFRDLNATTLTSRPTGGTDHQAFDAIGLPGFQFIQDPIEYSTRTHHSTQDVYERLQADDLKQSATVMAALIYQAANADERFPRKPMPER
jgi:hypothetical protein